MDRCRRRRSYTFSRALALTSHPLQSLPATTLPFLFFKPQHLNSQHIHTIPSSILNFPSSTTQHLHHVRPSRPRPLPLHLYSLPPRLPQRPHAFLTASHFIAHPRWPNPTTTNHNFHNHHKSITIRLQADMALHS